MTTHMQNRGKLIIVSAPSGTGKSTIINRLMKHEELNLAFSISCTSRAPRGTEQHGVEYFFLSPEEFKERIANGDFLEYEEVYTDRFYGTLKSQVESQLEKGENVVFDVDVKGACNIKQQYGSEQGKRPKRPVSHGIVTWNQTTSTLAASDLHLSLSSSCDASGLSQHTTTPMRLPTCASGLPNILRYVRSASHTSSMPL